MMLNMGNREILWGELLRSASNMQCLSRSKTQCLSREQRFELYREIHAVNVLPPPPIFWCMDWEITSVKEDRRQENPLILSDIEALPSEETCSGWKKVAKAVYREAVSKAGRPLGKDEVYGLGRMFLDDVVRVRSLSWRFDFEGFDDFNHHICGDPGFCWFCGDTIAPRSLVVFLHGRGWGEILMGNGREPIGGPICGRCISNSPAVVGMKATHNPGNGGDCWGKRYQRNIEVMASHLEKFPSFSMIHGYDAAQAFAKGCPDPEKIRAGKARKAA